MLLLFCFGFLSVSVLYYCICSPLNPYIYKMCKSNFSFYRNELILTYYSILLILFNMSSKFLHVDSVQFSRSVMSDSLQPCGLQHARLPCPITNSQSLLKLMSIESVMPTNHLILCRPLLFPPSIFPSIRVFASESVLCITLILLLLDFSPSMTSFLCRAYHPWFPVFLFSQYCSEHLCTYRFARLYYFSMKNC